MSFYFLKKKRTKSQYSKTIKNELISLPKNNHYSPEFRYITFINDDTEKKIKIESTSELSVIIKKLNFNIPYYIENGKEFIIINYDDLNYFFHNKTLSKIYNFSNYNFISEKHFKKQYEDINKERKYISNIKDIYFNNKELIKFHLPKYSYINFKYSTLSFPNFRDPVSKEDRHGVDIIEIFSKQKIGISTELFVYFSQYRQIIRANQRFIPFFTSTKFCFRSCRFTESFGP